MARWIWNFTLAEVVVTTPSKRTRNVTENSNSKDIAFSIDPSAEDCDVAVAEFKMLWADVNRITTEIYMFTQGADSKATRAVLTNFSYSKLYPYANGADKTPYDAPVSIGTWFTFRIEYRLVTVDGKVVPEVTYKVDGNTIMVENDLYGTAFYADGVINSAAIPKPGDIAGLRIRISSSVKSGSVYIDNVVFRHNYDEPGEA